MYKRKPNKGHVITGSDALGAEPAWKAKRSDLTYAQRSFPVRICFLAANRQKLFMPARLQIIPHACLVIPAKSPGKARIKQGMVREDTNHSKVCLIQTYSSTPKTNKQRTSIRKDTLK